MNMISACDLTKYVKIPLGVYKVYKLPALTIHDEECLKYYLTIEENKNLKLKGINEQTRRNFIFARIICKKMISENSDVDFSAISVIPGNNGQPTIKIHDEIRKDMQVSISHSEGVLFVELGINKHIGIDCQRIYDFACIIKANLIFTKREKEFVLSRAKTNEQCNRLFTLLWCLKEAFVKLRQTGFKSLPKNVEIIQISFAKKTVCIAENNEKLNLKFNFSCWNQYFFVSITY